MSLERIIPGEQKKIEFVGMIDANGTPIDFSTLIELQVDIFQGKVSIASFKKSENEILAGSNSDDCYFIITKEQTQLLYKGTASATVTFIITDAGFPNNQRIEKETFKIFKI